MPTYGDENLFYGPNDKSQGGHFVFESFCFRFFNSLWIPVSKLSFDSIKPWFVGKKKCVIMPFESNRENSIHLCTIF